MLEKRQRFGTAKKQAGAQAPDITQRQQPQQRTRTGGATRFQVEAALLERLEQRLDAPAMTILTQQITFSIADHDEPVALGKTLAPCKDPLVPQQKR